MNILFCSDERMCCGIFLAAVSVLRNTDEVLNVYILTAESGEHKKIPEAFCEMLQAVLKEKNCQNSVKLTDITNMFLSELPMANINTRFTPFCMLRLFADAVDDIPDKILYLDTDVICRADISELYATDISNIEIAGVPDRYGKWFFGNILKHNYLNSGVLLMNMKNIRKSGLLKKCREMCQSKKMFMPDQSALNKLAVKEKLPRIYNEQGKIKNDTVLKHFTTYFTFLPYFHTVNIKPWNVEKLHSELGIYEFDGLIEDYEKFSSVQNENIK